MDQVEVVGTHALVSLEVPIFLGMNVLGAWTCTAYWPSLNILAVCTQVWSASCVAQCDTGTFSFHTPPKQKLLLAPLQEVV